MVGFGSSSALATAYGIAVTATMVLTTVMTFFVVRFGWRYPLTVAVGATGFFLAIELVFFASNAVKVLSGGWFTLLVAGIVFTLMATRRLQADRFYTNDFRPEIYTAEGMAWIDAASMKSVLLRHHPSLASTGLSGVANAFYPWQ